MLQDVNSSCGQDAYRSELRRLVRAMSRANHESVLADDLAGGTPIVRVKMFVDGNLDKRLDKLEKQLEFIAEAFDDFEALIRQYIRETPLAALDTAAGDGQKMLDWLRQREQLTLEQLDHIVCQSARHQVEALGDQLRIEHIRFQELSSLAETMLDQLPSDGDLQLHLNPIRTWSRFHSVALLDEGAVPLADVVFFAVGGEISTAIMEPRGRRLLEELVEIAPCALSSWSAVSQLADYQELADLVVDLTEMGLVAIG